MGGWALPLVDVVEFKPVEFKLFAGMGEVSGVDSGVNVAGSKLASKSISPLRATSELPLGGTGEA
jgi:hypothetical protein